MKLALDEAGIMERGRFRMIGVGDTRDVGPESSYPSRLGGGGLLAYRRGRIREPLLGIGDEEGILRFGMRHRRREMGRYRIGPLRPRLAVSLPGPPSAARAFQPDLPPEENGRTSCGGRGAPYG